MIRRQMLKIMGALALAALFSVPTIPNLAKAQEAPPCSCCDENCACEDCGYSETCGDSENGCTKGCCNEDEGAVNATEAGTTNECCGESCACGSCGCSGRA